MSVTVDESLRALIPPLSPEERELLEKSIVEHGCRDPLVTWRGVLLDGHNRFDICQQHGIEFTTAELAFDEIEQARVWMRDNQMGRRNLTMAWRIELQLANKDDLAKIGAAKRAETLKQNQGTADPVLSQNDKTEPEPKHNTQAEIAKAANTSTGMIGMAEVVRKADPELWEQAKAGDTTVSAAYQQVRRQAQLADTIATRPHVSNNSGNNEWYTPPAIIECARRVLGNIDFDPASSEVANRTVQADKYLTAEDDGLCQKWHGRVFMNPPYSQPLIGQFCAAVVEKYADGEITEACVLTNNATDTRWLQDLFSAASAVCFIRGRVKYLDHTGQPSLSPLQGQCISYLGKDPSKFVEEFSVLGECLRHG